MPRDFWFGRLSKTLLSKTRHIKLRSRSLLGVSKWLLVALGPAADMMGLPGTCRKTSGDRSSLELCLAFAASFSFGAIGLFIKEMFRFPAWNGKAHMCWLCGASQGTFKDASMSAPWRFLRYSRNAFLETLRAKGVRPCPIFLCSRHAPWSGTSRLVAQR